VNQRLSYRDKQDVLHYLQGVHTLYLKPKGPAAAGEGSCTPAAGPEQDTSVPSSATRRSQLHRALTGAKNTGLRREICWLCRWDFASTLTASKQPKKLRNPLTSVEMKAGTFQSTFPSATGHPASERSQDPAPVLVPGGFTPFFDQ